MSLNKSSFAFSMLAGFVGVSTAHAAFHSVSTTFGLTNEKFIESSEIGYEATGGHSYIEGTCSVGQFDPELGTLDSVQVTASWNTLFGWDVTGADPNQLLSSEVMFTGAAGFGRAGSGEVFNDSELGNGDVGPYNGTIDGSGQTSSIATEGGWVGEGTVTIPVWSDLTYSPYMTGSIAFEVSGSINGAFGGSVVVEYFYTPASSAYQTAAVPEPSSIGIAVCGCVLFTRRRLRLRQ